MVGPYLLGRLVQDLSTGDRNIHLGRTVVLFLTSLAVQAYFVRLVRLRGAVLGERMLADLREDFLVRSVSLPPSVLERAGTGDLLSRITTDIDRLSNAMREAVPELAIAVVWVAAADRRARRHLAAAGGVGTGRRAAAGGGLPLVLQARAAGLPGRGRRVRRRLPPGSPSPSTPGAPSRRTAWARAGRS